MRSRKIIALCGVTVALALVPAAALAAGGTAVTIQIEGLKKTLLLPTVVRPHGGFITRYGAPAGKCPGKSAQGALQVAAHGKWAGTWYSSFNEYLVTSILGEKPKGANYWEFFVNNKSSTLGACDIKLHPGEHFLFADERGAQHPAGLTAPHSAVKGTPFTVKLVGYTAKGKAVPLPGVVITGNGISAAKTDSHGMATITDERSGVLVLRTAPKRYVRTEAIVHVAA